MRKTLLAALPQAFSALLQPDRPRLHKVSASMSDPHGKTTSTTAGITTATTIRRCIATDRASSAVAAITGRPQDTAAPIIFGTAVAASTLASSSRNC